MFIDLIRNKLAKFFVGQSDAAKSTEQRPGGEWGSPFRAGWGELYADLQTPGSRLDRYEKYRFLDQNLAEASAVLNVYADNVVSGTIGGEETYYIYIDDETPQLERLEEIITTAERRMGIKDRIWELSRNLLRDGDEFLEPIVVEEDGEYVIDRLKELPAKEMFADITEHGNFRDSKFPYYQRAEATGKPVPFDWWRCVHFKIGSKPYGYEGSIFGNAALRIGRQLLWIDDALVMARLSRAWKRYAYLIDTGNLPPDEAFAFVEKFMQRLKTKQVMSDRTTGRTGLVDAPLLPDEDIGLPTGDGAKSNVVELGGDANIANIADIIYFQNKFLMATTTPKAYVSLEEGTRNRSTMGYIDVQFARQVRRRQQATKPGLMQIYKLIFTLAGVDPASFKWAIEFPELATGDELIKFELLKMKADVAKVLAVDVGAVNTDYILRELLDFDEEMVRKYGANLQAGTGADNIPLPVETAMLVRRDPQVRAILSDLKDMISWKVGREQVMRDKVAVGVKPTKSFGKEE